MITSKMFPQHPWILPTAEAFSNLWSQLGVLLALVKGKLSHSLSECETLAVLLLCYEVHNTALTVLCESALTCI